MANIADIKTNVATVATNYFDSLIATGNKPTTDDNTGLIQKCMDQVCLDQLYTDKLPELDGDEKEFGAYIEEYAQALVIPKAATTLEDGKEYSIPYVKVNLQGTYTSWKLPEYIVAASTSVRKYKAAMRNAGDYGTFCATQVKAMQDSYNQTRYEEKKALLQWAAKNVAQSTTGLAKPTDTATGEAFIKAIKNAVETASFARDVTVDSKTITLGAAENFTLYITKGIESVLDVDTLAGAIHAEKLALPCAVKVVDVDDFGGGYAMLVDNRAVKLFPNRNDVAEDVVGYHDFVTYSRHVEDTPFVSKFATIVKFSA
jgi:hypothetical protein